MFQLPNMSSSGTNPKYLFLGSVRSRPIALGARQQRCPASLLLHDEPGSLGRPQVALLQEKEETPAGQRRRRGDRTGPVAYHNCLINPKKA
jgi:hypothetical protein